MPNLKLPIPIVPIVRVLAIIAVILSVLGCIANIYIYHIAEHPDTKIASLMQRFDLGFEPSLPGYYSVFLLLFSSILLWLIYRFKSNSGQGKHWFWLFLSVTFLYLSIDEAIMIHEMTDGTLQNLLQTSGVFYLAWVLPAMILVTIFVIISIPFLISLESSTRNLFILSGAVFVGGAIGMEMIAALVIESEGVESIKHSFIQTAEESMEMFGIILFIYTLLRYLNMQLDSIQFTFAKEASDTDH